MRTPKTQWAGHGAERSRRSAKRFQRSHRQTLLVFAPPNAAAFAAPIAAVRSSVRSSLAAYARVQWQHRAQLRPAVEVEDSALHPRVVRVARVVDVAAVDHVAALAVAKELVDEVAEEGPARDSTRGEEHTWRKGWCSVAVAQRAAWRRGPCVRAAR
eukprot:5931880-Prymnesium_polylepis.1